MKKKWMRLTVIAAAVMAVLAAGVLHASETDNSFDLKEAGVTFNFPEEWQELQGLLMPAYGYEMDQGSGVYVAGLTYCAMPKEKYTELSEKTGDLTDEEKAYVADRMIDIFWIFAIDGGRELEELKAVLSSYGVNAEGLTELAQAGDYHFYFQADPYADIRDDVFVLEDDFQEEFNALLPQMEDPAWVDVYEPEVNSGAQAGDLVIFETTDLDGNTVLSEEIFRENTLTMVNLWGTYCGPCINEMPELEELYGRLKEKNCDIIGIVCDVRGQDDSAGIAAAQEIIEDTGVTYRNLLPWEGMDQVFPAQFIPTTYFVDSDGQVVGEAAIGARGADEYEALVDELL